MNAQTEYVEELFLRQGAIFREECAISEDFSDAWDNEESENDTYSYQNTEEWLDTEQLWCYPADRQAVKNQFSERYAEYMEVRNAERERFLLNEMMDLMGQLNTYRIYGRIFRRGVYKLGDENNITQDAHIKLFESLQTDKADGLFRPNAVDYYSGIYKKQTMDYLRFYGLLKTRRQKEQEEAGGKGSVSEKKSRAKNTVKKSSIRSALSIEALTMNEDEEDISERKLFLASDSFEQLSNHQAKSRKLLTIYLQELMSYSKQPAPPLAVMYARVLYQMERLLDAEAIDTLVDAYMREKGWVNSADDKYYDEHLSIATADVQKYTTSTSPDWALHRMGTKTIAVLTDESEACIQRLFDRSLCWSKSFSKALSQTAFGESSLLWRDVVYTRAFSRTDIERWACDTHNSILKTSAKIVCDTPELLNFVLEEIHPANKMKKAVVQRKKVH